MDRNCDKCIHHTSGTCSSWDCKMQTVEDLKKEVREKTIEEFAKKASDKIGKFVLEHQDQLDFVSGVGMGWRIIEEVEEELKKNSNETQIEVKGG